MSAEELLKDGTTTVQGAVREFGVGKSRLYELMAAGRLPYSQLGARRLLPRVAIRRLLAEVMVGVETEVVSKRK